MLSPCLLMIHNASACSQDNVPELSTWQELHHPLLQIPKLNVVAWRNDTCLVEATIELDDDLAVSMIINFLKFADITWKMTESV